jgi:hypothetical protein
MKCLDETLGNLRSRIDDLIGSEPPSNLNEKIAPEPVDRCKTDHILRLTRDVQNYIDRVDAQVRRMYQL